MIGWTKCRPAQHNVLRLIPTLRTVITVLCLVAASSSVWADQTEWGPALVAGQRVMVLGDSITQDGRYLSYVEYYLQKQSPKLDFDFINIGLASETASGLSEEGHPGPRPCIHDRLDLALADVKPQLVIACYGMNDGIYKPLNDGRRQAFERGVTRLVEKCRAAGAKMILITPPAYDIECHGGIETMKFDYDSVLEDYSAWEAASRPGEAMVIHIHDAIRQQIKPCRAAGHPLHNPGDGVHPTEMGHFVIAREVLAALQTALPSGELKQQLADAQADPLYQLVRQRQSSRGLGWLQYIGYTRVNQTTPSHMNDIQAVEAQAAEQLLQINALRRR